MTINPFDALGVQPSFDLDLHMLDERHRDLSAALHPDRYANKPANERRMALDKAIEVNTAWRSLKDPIKRASSLLEHLGVPTAEKDIPPAGPALLMEMMEVREQLADAKASKSLQKIGELSAKMGEKRKTLIESLSKGFDEANGNREQLMSLLPHLSELRYVKRFFDEVEAIEDEWMG